jgi:hypothetical protein
MRNVLKSSAPIVAGALAALALAAPAAAQFGPPPNLPDMVNHNPIIYTTLGNASGFTGVIDKASGQLCYMMNTPDLANPTAAAIADNSGKTVLKLTAPTGSASGGCATLDAGLAQALVANAGDYTVQVDTAAYPAGAAWGKLSMMDPTKNH